MREIDVRKALYESEIQRLIGQNPSALIIDELGILEGKYRIDVAVIDSGRLHGYEIKSASDNLERLASQQASYNQIFDRMTLVADERHVAEALKLIPSWWGLIAVSIKDGQPYLNEIWPSRQNLQVVPESLCQLLWRGEALQILVDLGLASGMRMRSRKLMWKMIAKILTLEELRTTVCDKLKSRTGWRIESPPSANQSRVPAKSKTRRRTSRARKSNGASRRRKIYSPLPDRKSLTR